MFCPNCGKENLENSAGCAFCGVQLQRPHTSTTPVRPIQPSKTDGYAIASLIFSILGFFTCGIGALIGLILGLVSMSRIGNKRSNLQGRGLATAGIVVSIIALIVGIIGYIVMAPAFRVAKERARKMQELDRSGELPRLQLSLPEFRSEIKEISPRLILTEKPSINKFQ